MTDDDGSSLSHEEDDIDDQIKSGGCSSPSSYNKLGYKPSYRRRIPDLRTYSKRGATVNGRRGLSTNSPMPLLPQNSSGDDDESEDNQSTMAEISAMGGSSSVGGNCDRRYCLCKEVSFGEMIACDNARCEIEWFHFGCVDIRVQPKGKWYCPRCRGESVKVKRLDI